ncbi:TPA: O8 family O-antigen export ABC transporter ATP-binding subunit [Klebsiella pneumoniae]|uniref:O8 family O-antigen export ABC transporter ATP-binding subunit n=1 Tax=Klebsiella pneumoniae TaxID=573 RepID=UPI00077F9D7E|nr:O8 family O-antigen export ABC transporter ATP-binding subunit [Klebsiella pneumoniae]AXZ12476.1 ABC transporter ATP-binding protein [Klebsiella pneumoniae]KYL93513.1 sugar ABC transporter ATP-binding protein [Klebsiella pneumoniae]MCP6773213.1 O8 family O-antigen export ABC transporter ATP-binding subunit [Klebsiella pneumoniae]MCX9857540.1 O8 family O-antigen export ABC transporter ATP-binding subunit [Klebsiella pneumoniae]MCX9867852.1 O8 family O-antigen export ABC transporter ATP-bindi
MSYIRVKNVGKAYRQYHSKTGRLFEWLSPLNTKRHNLKWILSDINFEVAPGEAVGIIGINGAGKSTLLKLITGTSRPTTGEIEISGRVAALLELGMGFHSDFTGRQNVYMSGQLLGLSSEKITELMPQIEEFAEIGDYIDQPVRVYSSGMQVRLAFSVATAIRPDVLIIDEALSVGDAYFQHKSFERIRKFRLEGTTLLLVSHDKQAIQSICDRAILLNKGHIEMEGEPEAVMDYYNALLADKQNQSIKQVEHNGKTQTVSGTGEVTISEVHLLDEQGNVTEFASVGHRISLQVNVEVKADIPELVVGYMIKDRLGQPIFGTNTHHLKQTLTSLKKGEKRSFLFSFDARLGVGSYSVAVALHTSSTHLGKNYEWRDLAVVFNVVNTEQQEFVGVSWLPPELEIS